MNSASNCSKTEVKHLPDGTAVTLKHQMDNVTISETINCTIVFSSNGKFTVQFDELWIETSAVMLNFFLGKDDNSLAWVSTYMYM